MELYIEKLFLDDLYLSLDEKHVSLGQHAVNQIMREYGLVNWFIDCPIESPEKLDQLQNENPLFAYRSNYSPPVPVKNIKNHFFKNSDCEQTLIFCLEEMDWFQQAEKKGALCFSFNNYEEKIQEIINKCHTRFSLTNPFINWDYFKFLAITPLNFLWINDNYLLTDADNQKMDQNILPFLSNALKGKEDAEIKVKIFTLDLRPLPPGSKEKIKEKAKKRLRRLESAFLKFNMKFQIISNEHIHLENIDLHDRVVLSNFIILECPIGFNLIPYKKSNSKIESFSIFDPFSYKRMNEHRRMHENYLQKLKSKIIYAKFISYPEL